MVILFEVALKLTAKFLMTCSYHMNTFSPLSFCTDQTENWIMHACLLVHIYVYQARNQLGTPGGAKSFLTGAQIF